MVDFDLNLLEPLTLICFINHFSWVIYEFDLNKNIVISFNTDYNIRIFVVYVQSYMITLLTN